MMVATDHTNDDHMDINLRTLRRSDPAVKAILGSASQVAAYEYNRLEWRRLDIEGSMFLVSRTTAPYYSIIINNRLNTENFVEPITSDHEFRLDLRNESAFLMVHNNALRKISCFWFYEADEMLAVYKKLESIANEIAAQNSTKKSNLTRIAFNSGSNEPVENVLAKLGINTLNGVYDANQSLSSFSSSVPIPPNSSISTNLTSGPQTPAAGNVLQTLFANSTHKSNKEPIKESKAEDVSSRIKGDKKSKPLNGISLNLDDLFNGASSSSGHPSAPKKNKSNEEMILTPAMLKNGKKLEEPNDVKRQSLFGSNVNTNSQMSPPMLSSQLADSLTSKLHKPDAHKQPVLSMEKLKQTMMYLLQNDADFLHCIHSAYLNGINRT